MFNSAFIFVLKYFYNLHAIFTLNDSVIYLLFFSIISIPQNSERFFICWRRIRSSRMSSNRSASPNVLGEGRAAAPAPEAHNRFEEWLHLYGQGEDARCWCIHMRGTRHGRRLWKESIGFAAGHTEDKNWRKWVKSKQINTFRLNKIYQASRKGCTDF